MPVEANEIDRTIDRLEQGELQPEVIIEDVRKSQPWLYDYFYSDSFSYLTPAEKDLFLFLFSVLWEAGGKNAPEVSAEELEDADDSNWSMLEKAKGKQFTEKLDDFFEQSEEEELLAFYEDALADADEAGITAVGREWIFVGVKTATDVLLS